MKPGPLTIGAGVGAILAALLIPATRDALDALATARGARAAAAVEAELPPRIAAPLVAAGQALPPGNPQAALRARMRDLAKRGGLLVEDVRGIAAPEGLAAVRFSISGSEKGVIAFADTLERDAPLVRLARWRIAPLAEGGVRLTGTAVGATR